MSIKVNIDSQFVSQEKDSSKDVKLELSGHTVGECLGQFLSTKPDLKRGFFDKGGKLEKSTYIFLNKVPIFSSQLERELKDGDDVMILFVPQWRC